MFRIRISPGWKLNYIAGNFIIKTADLLAYLTDENKTLIYDFEIQDALSRSDNFSMQTALLYTNSKGERRIRCHNYLIPLTSNIQEIYQHIDPVILTSTLTKTFYFDLNKNLELAILKQRAYNRTKDIIKKSSEINNKTIHEPVLVFS